VSWVHRPTFLNPDLAETRQALLVRSEGEYDSDPYRQVYDGCGKQGYSVVH
jgi:hypothetical protein